MYQNLNIPLFSDLPKLITVYCRFLSYPFVFIVHSHPVFHLRRVIKCRRDQTLSSVYLKLQIGTRHLNIVTFAAAGWLFPQCISILLLNFIMMVANDLISWVVKHVNIVFYRRKYEFRMERCKLQSCFYANCVMILFTFWNFVYDKWAVPLLGKRLWLWVYPVKLLSETRFHYCWKYASSTVRRPNLTTGGYPSLINEWNEVLKLRSIV